MKRVTELNAVLADWDEKELPDKSIKTFSVKFVDKSGKVRYIKRGRKIGLRFSMKDNDMKAVQPVDRHGNDIGHVYPVWIHAIQYYSGNIIYNVNES